MHAPHSIIGCSSLKSKNTYNICSNSRHKKVQKKEFFFIISMVGETNPFVYSFQEQNLLRSERDWSIKDRHSFHACFRFLNNS